MSPGDSRDWIFENLARGVDSAIPAVVDYTKYVNCVRDQGFNGTCAAIVGVVIKEIQENIGQHPQTILSPEFIYYHRCTKPAHGMYGRDVFKVINKFGIAEGESYVDPPDSGAYESAAKHKINHYARINTINGIKRALAELGPCYLALPLYEKNLRFWSPTNSEDPSIGHAVAVIGYDKKGLIILNSWGESWGNSGTTILPYDDWPATWEAWVPIGDSF